MYSEYIDEAMLQAYIHDTTQILEKIEHLMIQNEQVEVLSIDVIDQVFRDIHTIKVSSATMMYNNISEIAHVLEDLISIIRNDITIKYNLSILTDLIFEGLDFYKIELLKVSNNQLVDGDTTNLKDNINIFIDEIRLANNLDTYDNTIEVSDQYYINKKEDNVKCYYKVHLMFDDGCEMENIRAYTVVQNMMEKTDVLYYQPNNIIENESTMALIKESGFNMVIKTELSKVMLEEILNETIFLESLTVNEMTLDEFDVLSILYQTEIFEEPISETQIKLPIEKEDLIMTETPVENKVIGVSVDKLDALMNLVGELVIAESMVTENPEVTELKIESFDKASRLLNKLSSDLQDMVMGIRMVPLTTTFLNMHRVVKDMKTKCDKEVTLEVYGESTEVDKNIIEKLKNPLIQIIRNAIEYGIESPTQRTSLGKSKQGLITLQAENSGSDVLIVIKDDGKGLNKKLIYDKAVKQQIVSSNIEDLSDYAIYQLILHPGYSTHNNEIETQEQDISMYVIHEILESVGGAVLVDSIPDKSTTITVKIPITQAIIEGMNLRVGQSRFTLPLMTIKESFRPKHDDVFKDPSGNEMIILRGSCYPILRLHEYYGIATKVKKCHEGILVMIEENEKSICVLADELIGQQQVVVKTLPGFIKAQKNIKGVSGCTLLGDGNISLILDVKDLNNFNKAEVIQ